jgi:hypothetical protein
MLRLHPKAKYGAATIWFFVIIAFIAVAAMIQTGPITIAVSDNLPSISTPITPLNEANRLSMEERPAAIGAQMPNVHPGTQIFYRGGNVAP